MRFALKLLLVLIFLVPLLALVFVYLGAEDQALIKRHVELTDAEIERAKRLFRKHDPRRSKDGEVKTIVVTEQELDLAANHILGIVGRGGAMVTLEPERMGLKASLELPKNPFGSFVNMDAVVVQTSDLPRIRVLRIGQLNIPGWLANLLLKHALSLLYAPGAEQAKDELIQHVVFGSSTVAVTYQWRSELGDGIRTALIDDDDKERMRIFHDRLAQVTGRRDGGRVELSELVRSMLALAEQRLDEDEPVADNRAAILVLAAYVNGRGLRRLVPESKAWPAAKQLTVTLQGRRDFAQHFATSAALVVMSNRLLSNAIGLFKEVDDSRGGSGFSFEDLAADRAGTQFGEVATHSKRRARRLLADASPALSDTDLMPSPTGLPKSMSESEFKRRYGGVDSAAYRQVLDEIDRRVARSRLYQ